MIMMQHIKNNQGASTPIAGAGNMNGGVNRDGVVAASLDRQLMDFISSKSGVVEGIKKVNGGSTP